MFLPLNSRGFDEGQSCTLRLCSSLLRIHAQLLQVLPPYRHHSSGAIRNSLSKWFCASVPQLGVLPVADNTIDKYCHLVPTRAPRFVEISRSPTFWPEASCGPSENSKPFSPTSVIILSQHRLSPSWQWRSSWFVLCGQARAHERVLRCVYFILSLPLHFLIYIPSSCTISVAGAYMHASDFVIRGLCFIDVAHKTFFIYVIFSVLSVRCLYNAMASSWLTHKRCSTWKSSLNSRKRQQASLPDVFVYLNGRESPVANRGLFGL